jgi:hypothetical protein
MSSLLTAVTVSDLLHQLGDIPPERVRLQPPPGTATEADVVAVHSREDRLCELVDGVLVEKTLGYYESYITVLDKSATLEGRVILPGFTLLLSALFPASPL